MKTKINHIFGNQEDLDLQIVKLSLDLENSKELEALEQGWLIYDNKWYNSRSVRINIDNYKPQGASNKKLKKYSFVYHDHFYINDEVINVYNTFINLKQFKKIYRLDTDIERSSGVFVYDYNHKLVAYTKMVKYEGGIESQFTVWDYSEPKASIGKNIIDYEIEVAKNLGHKYLYIGPAYGINSTYKINLSGFEWWNGENWNIDEHKMFQLLERDTKIKTLEDLSDAFIQDS